jgi:hypothetical protein
MSAGPVRRGRAAASPDDGCGGAGSLGGCVPGTDDRTNDSARPFVGADPPRQLRRSRSSASRAAANHPPALGVNRDASHYCGAPGSDLAASHGAGVRQDCSGSVVRRTAASGAGPARRSLRRNRFDRGRSSCRSVPGRDSQRTGTAAPISPRRGRSRRQQVDIRHDCRDTCPACVPSTVWGTAPSVTAKFTHRRRACPSNEGTLLP